MIYELWCETLRPRTLPQGLDLLEAECGRRGRFTPLGGAWYTDIGPLNQLVHVWAYADLAGRQRVTQALAAQPRELDALVVRTEVGLYTPLPGGELRPPGRLGPIYELRRYRARAAGGVQRYVAGWERHLERRLALSAPALAAVSEVGSLNTLVQLWPYGSLDQRARVRRTAVETGVLPPPGALEALEAMENRILLPTAFSPLQ